MNDSSKKERTQAVLYQSGTMKAQNQKGVTAFLGFSFVESWSNVSKKK
jgi:hypothetical protein